MNRSRIASVLTVPLALVLSTGSFAAPAGERTMLDRRARETAEVLKGKRKAADIFNRHFLNDVPADRLAELGKQLKARNGKVVGVEDVQVEGKSAATFRIRFERAIGVGRITLERAEPFKVSGFRIAAVLPIGDTPDRIAADFAALPGRAGFAVARLGDGDPPPVFERHADDQFAIGSTFKLWVLDALAEEIAARRRRWDEVVRIGPRSLPGGIMQDWPPDAPVTIETLATLMISQSDNTATDTLMRLIGRDRISERVRAIGHADAGRMLPMLTTAEAFALKLGPADRRAAYAGADDKAQTALLAGIDAATELAPVKPAMLDGAPLAIDSIEWFASPRDLVRVLDSLRRREDPRVLAILGMATNLDETQERRFAYVGYKGGSESGVRNLTWLLRDHAGDWFAVTASWNDPSRALAVDRLETLGARLVALVRRAP